ncbi:MAG: glycoside hydrolase family 88 protein [Clostridiales bacterium]|jgi:unsaturated chondroitin disaccharide hydrolase|nr:glycoside hydrolase family 88 protein [Clostridiales bacterium]
MAYNLKREDAVWAAETFEKIKVKMLAECKRVGTNIPFVPRDGKYHDLDGPEGIYWWTNGFWPGMLWQMYNATREEIYKETAIGVELRLDEALNGFEHLHHDVGFMWLHSAVADYRLTGSKESLNRGLHAATLLAGRFNPGGKYIRAWNGENIGWLIVDCMMNIQLLFWASEETGDPRFRQIAEIHADTCARIVLRPDGSSNHIVVVNPETGEFLDNPGGQGYASGSSWSRGQAWALYGFALTARRTGEAAHLDASKRVAHYFISNLAISNWLPIVDFRAPEEPVAHDSSAAAIAACGLLELAELVPELEKNLYLVSALKTLQACEKSFANWDPSQDAIIGSAAGAYHSSSLDARAPIIYGDYFFIEAVLRLAGKAFEIF